MNASFDLNNGVTCSRRVGVPLLLGATRLLTFVDIRELRSVVTL